MDAAAGVQSAASGERRPRAWGNGAELGPPLGQLTALDRVCGVSRTLLGCACGVWSAVHVARTGSWETRHGGAAFRDAARLRTEECFDTNSHPAAAWDDVLRARVCGTAALFCRFFCVGGSHGVLIL